MTSAEAADYLSMMISAIVIFMHFIIITQIIPPKKCEALLDPKLRKARFKRYGSMGNKRLRG